MNLPLYVLGPLKSELLSGPKMENDGGFWFTSAKWNTQLTINSWSSRDRTEEIKYRTEVIVMRIRSSHKDCFWN